GSNTTQAPAGGGLFGGSTSQPAQVGSLFGTTASQPQTTTSLFGATTNTQPQQTQQSGGLFGASTAQPQQTGGLFGSAPQQQQQQQTVGGGLFGNQQASQPQQQVGGLFGYTTTQPQQQQAGGLFGTAPAQPAQTGGLFGAAPQSQPAQPGSLFGTSSIQQQQQQQPQAGGGLFGSSTANTGGMFGPAAAGAFGQGAKPQGFGQANQGVGLTMGQSANQQPQVVPGVRIDVSNIRSTTRFNDLQEDLQKQIAMIDEGIQKCIRDKEAVDAFLPAHGDQLSAIPADVNFVTRKSEGADGALSGDLAAINQLRDLVKKDADNARLSFKAIDNLRLPTQYHQSGLWSTRGQQAATGAGSADADAESNSDLITFFSKTSDEMGEMMKKFERNLGEIEVHLHGVQGNMLEQLQRVVAQSKNGSQGGLDERVVELAAVLRDFEEGILKVAGVVGGVKEGITGLQLKDFMGYGI
ncbi:hypothetical protein B0T26DRAFT_776913, partial [Lasiosphaeria miniovina]